MNMVEVFRPYLKRSLNQACLVKKTREEWNSLFKGQSQSFWTSKSRRIMLRSSGFNPYETENCVQNYRGAVDFPAALFYRYLRK